MTSAALRAPFTSRDLTGNTPLTAAQAAMIGAMGFALTAMNGVPLSFSSLPIVIGISGLLLLQRSPRVIAAHAFAGPMRPFTFLFLGLAVVSMISAIASGELDSVGVALVRSVTPLLPLFALSGVKIRTRHIAWIVWGYAAGTALLLLRGTLAFYAEWGIPDLTTLLWARYDLFRMLGYMDATLGNLSHLGLYISLIAPLLIALRAYFRLPRALLWAIGFVLLLCLINALISGSRTALALIVPITALIFARRGVIPLFVFFSIVGFAALIALIYGLDAVNQADLINRFIPSEGASGFDASAVERIDSIYLGWDVFLQYPLLGVGPGMSHHYNTYGIPHQSIVYLLLETGIAGGILFALLCLLTIAKAFHAILSRDVDGTMYWRAAWLIGPASYCVFGIFSGIAFTMSISLVWIGMVCTMIPLAYARIVADDAA